MVFVHSGLTGIQLHNPKGIQYAEDVFNFNAHSWKNSGLIWNESLGKWKAKPSGGGSGYSTEGELTALLNDNYPGSSNINRALINTISSNIDTRVDSLFNWSSNKSLYANSANVHYRFQASSLSCASYKHSANSSIHGLSTTNMRIASLSSQGKISGQWWSPLYLSLTAAGAASTRPGQIIRTSGNSDGTWVWMSIYGGSSYQWMQLTYLSGV